MPLMGSVGSPHPLSLSDGDEERKIRAEGSILFGEGDLSRIPGKLLQLAGKRRDLGRGIPFVQDVAVLRAEQHPPDALVDNQIVNGGSLGHIGAGKGNDEQLPDARRGRHAGKQGDRRVRRLLSGNRRQAPRNQGYQKNRRQEWSHRDA